MTRGLVAVSTSTFGARDPAPRRRLEESGFTLRLNPHGRRLAPDETVDLLDGAIGLIAGTEALTRDVLARAPSLRALSRCGTGLDNVDLAAAAELGILVAASRSAHAQPVAELALAGLLALLRDIPRADRGVRAGSWERPMGSLLQGKTVGLVGLGRTGRAFTRLLRPFGVRLLAVDPRPDLDFGRDAGVEWVSLDALLRQADVVSLHLPYSPESRHLLGVEALASMKPGALLLNCARGGLVDEAALAAALAAGRPAGAYLDVFEDEPYRGPLTSLENVVLTPHLGSYAVEARVAMESEAVDNLERLLAGRGA